LIGQLISHYEILEELGSGGMGMVYKARDTELDRFVALKFLPPHLSQAEEEKKRFIHEAKAASALDHPNICSIYEIDKTADGQMFIVMACYGGESLKVRIERGPLPAEEALNIAIQIGQGLDKAHTKGIIHRDIKPANILITEDGQVKIIDFGLVKLKDRTMLTKTGATLGTVAYMSPEQTKGIQVDQRTDIWSLGVVMYEMLTGALPFKGNYEQAIIFSILNEDPELISTVNNDLPPELNHIIIKALAKDSNSRYQSMQDMLIDLRRMQKDLEVLSAAPGEETTVRKTEEPTRRKRSKSIILTFGAIVVLILVFLSITYLPPIYRETHSFEPEPIAVLPFENLTGNDAYDIYRKSIANLLIAKLEQSPYLQVTTWERMGDLLKQSGKEQIEIFDISKETAFDLCRMDGVDFAVTGSYSQIGTIIAIEVKVLNVASKQIRISATSSGEGDNSVFEQIDQLSQEISNGIGLSYRHIEEKQRPVAEVTTTSMEAYNYFIRGREEAEKLYFNESRKFLEKALEIDTTFALAYLYFGYACYQLGYDLEGKTAYEKAKFFVKQTTGKDSLFIEAEIAPTREEAIYIYQKMIREYPKEKRAYLWLGLQYFFNKDFNQALKAFEKALELDPYYGLVVSMIANSYKKMGDFEQALAYFKKYESLSPGDADPFDSLGDLYFRMGMLDKAKEKFNEVLEVTTEFKGAYKDLAYIYALSEDYIQALDYSGQFINITDHTTAYLWRGFYYSWLGMTDQASRDLNIAMKDKLKRTNYLKFYAELLMAVHYYHTGRLTLSRTYHHMSFRSYLDYYPDQIGYASFIKNLYLGLVDLKEQGIDSVRSRLSQMRLLMNEPYISPRRYAYNWARPEMMRAYELLRAELMLAVDSTDRAIEIYKNLQVLEIPPFWSIWLINYNLPPHEDLLARAYYRKGNIDQAISEYERLTAFVPQGPDRRLIRPEYHYELARLYEGRGLPEKAIERYERFLQIWRNADAHLPALTDAKKRLNALKNSHF